MTGDMRDRLIELLRCAPFCGYRFDDRYSVGAITPIADHLIANGVVLPPCKVGNTVYVINRANKPQEMIFDTVDLRCTCARDDSCMCGSLCGDVDHNICQKRFKNDFSDFGKTVFLTREEAEKALKEALA